MHWCIGAQQVAVIAVSLASRGPSEVLLIPPLAGAALLPSGALASIATNGTCALGKVSARDSSRQSDEGVLVLQKKWTTTGAAGVLDCSVALSASGELPWWAYRSQGGDTAGQGR